MGGWSMPHRVVVRNESGSIVRDIPCEHFAEGKPIFERIREELPEGHTVCLQAGIRVMLKHPEG